MDKKPGRIIPIETLTRLTPEMLKVPRTTFEVKLSESAPLELHAPPEQLSMHLQAALNRLNVWGERVIAKYPHLFEKRDEGEREGSF